MTGNRMRVFIVEDEALIVMELSDRLKRLDYDVCGTTAYGEKALELIPASRAEMVLMDIRLAGALNGIQTVEQLRHTYDVPVVFLTAFADSDLVREAVDVVPTGYLVKPFQERELHASLQVALQRHRLDRQLRETNQRLMDRTVELEQSNARLEAEIAERQRAESKLQILRDQLAHAARVATVGELMTGIAHELNQPLTAIGVIAEALFDLPKSQLVSHDDWRQQIATIVEMVERAGKIVKRIHQFTRKHIPQRAVFDARALIPPVLSMLEHSFRTWHTPCLIHVPESPLWVKGCAIEVQQVLINLIRNSIEAQCDLSPETRRIDVGIRRIDRDWIEFSVSDQGTGISPENQMRLFEPFFTTKPTGLGMGLRISESIITEHGGRIRYQTGDTGGAVFSFTLPAAKEVPA